VPRLEIDGNHRVKLDRKWLIAGGVTVALIAIWIPLKAWMDREVGEQYEKRILIIQSHFSSALMQHVMAAQSLPQGAAELKYWPADGVFGDDMLPRDFMVANMGFLPGSRFDEAGGVVSARLWLAHFPIPGGHDPHAGNLDREHPFLYDESGQSLGLPVLWYFYKHPTKGRMVGVSDGQGRAGNLTHEAFIDYLEAAFAHAQAHGIPHDPRQLDYARNFW